jgi:hypothetical protein
MMRVYDMLAGDAVRATASILIYSQSAGWIKRYTRLSSTMHDALLFIYHSVIILFY